MQGTGAHGGNGTKRKIYGLGTGWFPKPRHIILMAKAPSSAALALQRRVRFMSPLTRHLLIGCTMWTGGFVAKARDFVFFV